MNSTEKWDIVEALMGQARRANMLARLYEDAAETVAGFPDEATYQEHAADAFAGAMESIDLAEVRP
jgi:hypothetical protein